MTTTITPQAFISGTLQTVDTVIGNFVQTSYTHLVQNNLGTITLLFTFYIAFYGYKAMTHTASLDLNTVGRHITLMVIIYSLMTNWQFFNTFFYNIFTNEPEVIAQSFVNGSTTSVQDGLDTIFNQGMQASQNLAHMASWKDISLYLDAYFVFIATVLYCVIALGLFVYAKMAMAVLLFLAPLFFAFALWKPTRGFFERWVQSLINYALIPIITTAILILTEAITSTTLPGLQQTSTNPSFNGIIVYLGISVLNALLFKQVLNKAAALSAGFALEALGSAIPLAKSLHRLAASPTHPVFKGIHHLKGHADNKHETRKEKDHQKSMQAQAEKEKPNA